MRRLGAEPRGELLFRIAIAPAQEIDDVERADLAEQFAAAVRFRALQRLFQQRERLEPGGDLLRPVDDFADADDDGNAVFGEGGMFDIFLVSLSDKFADLILRHCGEAALSKDGRIATAWYLRLRRLRSSQ